MGVDLLEQRLEQVVGRAHPSAVGLEHVGLDQDRGPALERGVAGREARPRAAEVDPAPRIVPAPEVQVGCRQVPHRGEARDDAALEGLGEPVVHRLRHARPVVEAVGHVVLVIRPVGGVVVHQ